MHNCKIKHCGSAGAMEAVGSVRIFSRSEDSRNLRCTKYLGDGDSASFKRAVDSKSYGDKEVQTLECVGHVQRRCGTWLRRLKNESKSLKLKRAKDWMVWVDTSVNITKCHEVPRLLFLF